MSNGKLYGMEEEIVIGICDYAEALEEATAFIYQHYCVKCRVFDWLGVKLFKPRFETAWQSLIKKNFIQVLPIPITGKMPNLKEQIQCRLFRMTEDCIHYNEMVSDLESSQKGNSLTQNFTNYGVMSNAASVGDGNTISASVSVNDVDEMLKVIAQMRVELGNSVIDDDNKGDIGDDLNSIQKELESQTPDWALVGRAKKRLGKLLDIVKNVIPITTLMVHYNTLAPLIDSAIRAAGCC